MIKAAIIGYGYMGEIRRRVIDEHPDVELTLICETEGARLKNETKVKTTQSYSDVIESDAQLVFICTPNHLIPELAVECMKRGKHVFCEKPPGRSLADIQKIKAQEEKSPGVKLMFGFNHRYHPGVLKAKAMIDSGRFGRLLWLRGVYGKSGGKNYVKSWRNQKEIAGGGILLDQGIHMLDLFNFYAGGFTDVKAVVGNVYWPVEVEDNAFVILRNKEGQHASLHSSATLWKHKFAIEMGLENGYLRIEGLLSKTGSYGRETLKIGRRQFEDETEAVGNPSEEMIYFDRDLSWNIEVDKIVQSIVKNEPVKESNSADALEVMQIIEKAYASSRGEA